VRCAFPQALLPHIKVPEANGESVATSSHIVINDWRELRSILQEQKLRNKNRGSHTATSKLETGALRHTQGVRNVRVILPLQEEEYVHNCKDDVTLPSELRFVKPGLQSFEMILLFK
jgi:hypothetical protein